MSGDWRELLASRATEAGGRLTVRSALNPALWLCGIVAVPAAIAGALTASPPWWISVLVLAPVALAIFGYLFLLFFDRDKLQSEDFQIRKKTLEMFEQKGMSGPQLPVIEEVVTPDPQLIRKEEEQ
jgi:hypothetical protein